MVPVIWAQAMAEYGAMAIVTAKVASWYTQAELSLRTNPELWVLGVAVAVAAVWLLRRA